MTAPKRIAGIIQLFLLAQGQVGFSTLSDGHSNKKQLFCRYRSATRTPPHAFVLRLFFVFYHKIALRFTHEVNTRRNVVLGNASLQKIFLKVRANDFCPFFLFFMLIQKMRNKNKRFRHSYVYQYTQKSKLLNSLRHPINKAGSISSFRSEDIFPSVILSKKIKTFQ